MFDVGFMELVLVGLVALLAFGPERLPRVARQAGFWLRKARTTLAAVKAEIEHEMELQDMKQRLLETKQGRAPGGTQVEVKSAPRSIDPESGIERRPEPSDD
ncbi:MAG TPA: Sec-independent protein translocase protein TatB [Methylococcus sp.]|nr:Sec-independent protein translocase protein TatB [Methylococcus sp.]